MKNLLLTIMVLMTIATGSIAQSGDYLVSNAINKANTACGTPVLSFSPAVAPFTNPGPNNVFVHQDLNFVWNDLHDANGGNNTIWDSTLLPGTTYDVNGVLQPSVPGGVRGMNAAELALMATVQALPATNLATNITKAQNQRQNLAGGATPTVAQQNAIDRILLDIFLSQQNVLDYLLTPSQATLTVTHGGASKSNITLTWSAVNGFPDTCTLSTDTSWPAGLTCTFGTNPVGPLALTSVTTITASAGCVPGVYVVNFVATSTPFTNQTVVIATATITVN